MRPLPIPTPESAPFWDACRRRELRLQRCARCERHWFPPGPLCPECWSRDWAWTPLSGRGRVHSFVVYHRLYHDAFADTIPYVVAVVEVDEGPRLVSNIVGCAADEVRCDMAVEVVFEEVADGVVLPLFRPA